MPDYTILLIDYEPRSIERTRRPLTTAGYRVEVARDGVAGLEAFERLKPNLVLVEAMIPKKHGFEVCQDLKKTPQGKRTPVLITTAVYKGRKYRSQALHLYGCDDYIEKPLADESLITTCARFLGDDDVAGRLARLAGGTTAPAPPAEAAAEAATPAAAGASETADAEQEILARLDAILPGGPPSVPADDEPEIEVVLDDPEAALRPHTTAPEASVAHEPASAGPAESQVISLDEVRARKRRRKGKNGGGADAGGRRGGAGAGSETAAAVAAEPRMLASERPVAQVAPSPRAETLLDPQPLADAASRPGMPAWIGLIALVAAAALGVLLWLALGA